MFFSAMWRELGGDPAAAERVQFAGDGPLPSVFAVSGLAASAIGAAGAAVAELILTRFADAPRVCVDRKLSSLWFSWSMRPIGWELPNPWDPVAGDYAAADGWIRLHTNAPHHRDAALSVLGAAAERAEVARAVSRWEAHALESSIVDRGGCAAMMRSQQQWKQHPQGESVGAEPLLALETTGDTCRTHWSPDRHRPLRGIRVLDLTRVLAGPVATRFLAGFGADVLRIDPPAWDEPGVIPEVTLGKRCARLDLRDPAGLARLRELLREADILVHGYRADALAKLGFTAQARRELRPGLIDVSLNAYGWSGPWRNRRGFDSLVQMSAGIAETGMRALQRDRPTPLPVQALDHATGYLMAAAAIRGLTERLRVGRGFEARTSLARTAALLTSGPTADPSTSAGPASEGDWSDETEHSGFGPLRRLRAPLEIDEAPMHWDRPASRLGAAPPEW